MEAPQTPDPSPMIIGWREFLALPDWGIPRIKAKIDTGARTSAVHVDNIELLPEDRIRFEVVVREKPRFTVPVETTIHRFSRVRPTHDRVEMRPVVLTRLQLGEVEQMIELALVARPGMLCRMLLGRRALGPGILVDANRRYVVSSSVLR
ncbi:MAG: ATP-dependent zinc protease [Planctomycetes bacterium]|nr:ATP-dependent zinc protease [Planctomycetota bacterium]